MHMNTVAGREIIWVGMQAGRQLIRWAGAAPGGVVPGGYITHFLDPRMTAFQAEVELGSLWKVDPERAGPMINHLRARSQDLLFSTIQ